MYLLELTPVPISWKANQPCIYGISVAQSAFAVLNDGLRAKVLNVTKRGAQSRDRHTHHKSDAVDFEPRHRAPDASSAEFHEVTIGTNVRHSDILAEWQNA
jgi:hypothetical protein